jgi:hypothetical protein
MESVSEYKELVSKFESRHGKLPASVKSGYAVFRRNKNFTTVVLHSKAKTVITAGASKRNPIDNENELVGKNLAIWHAFETIYEAKNNSR